jgi:hypothetical membrane protein
MQASKRIAVFTDRYPLIGPAFWIVSVQYFIIQLIVGLLWSAHYSLLQNTISDLGNTACGDYFGRYVCSPAFTWMNASFITLGLTIVCGSILIFHEFRQSWGSFIGFSMMASAGIGTILVGIFPENINSTLHSVGAFMPFFFGNIALIIFGLALEMPSRLRLYSISSGAVGLVAFLIFLTHTYLGLGLGGMERVVAYPQTIWLIVFGFYVSRDRYLVQKDQAKPS